MKDNINRIGTLLREIPRPMRRAYCTNCKLVVDIRSSSYVRLANHKAAIEGFCPICNSVLLNARVMPTSSKKPMGSKRRRKKLSIYS
jgi:RNase P subunit RPR2